MLMVRRNSNPVLSDLINDFFTNDFVDRMDHSLKVLPKTNIIENEKSYDVEMMVPGYNKGDFQLNVEKDTLIISANKEIKKEEKDDSRVVFREFTVNSFERSFTMSNDVDANGIEATYENGVLHISIPKKKEAIVKKLIKIK
jgi:HSP20 family protein